MKDISRKVVSLKVTCCKTCLSRREPPVPAVSPSVQPLHVVLFRFPLWFHLSLSLSEHLHACSVFFCLSSSHPGLILIYRLRLVLSAKLFVLFLRKCLRSADSCFHRDSIRKNTINYKMIENLLSFVHPHLTIKPKPRC